MVKCNITQLRNNLVRQGMNPKDAIKLAKLHCNYLNRVYPDASINQKAKIAMTLGS